MTSPQHSRRRRRSNFLDDCVDIGLMLPAWPNIVIAGGLFLGAWYGVDAYVGDNQLTMAFAPALKVVMLVLAAMFGGIGLVKMLQSPRKPAPETGAIVTARTEGSTKTLAERRSDDAVSKVESAPLHFIPPSAVTGARAGGGDSGTLAEQLMKARESYLAQPTLLTGPEQRAYQWLRDTYGDSVIIFSKVRVVDVITPNQRRYAQHSKEYLALFRQLSQWHLDFVLVDPARFSVLCAIELDDASHQREDRKRRDRILNNAFLSAGVRLERMHWRSGQLHATPVSTK